MFIDDNETLLTFKSMSAIGMFKKKYANIRYLRTYENL